MKFYVRQNILIILLVTVASAVGLAAQTPHKEGGVKAKGQMEARRLWEQMVEVKGGRAKLHSITNMMLKKGGDKADFTQIEFYVYPERYWEWSQGKIAGRDFLFVKMANLERGVFMVATRSGLATDKEKLNQPGGAPFGEGYLMDSCPFLLETKWLQPTPVRVLRKTVGREEFDVVETRFPGLKEYKDWRQDFYIDPESLIVRGVASYTAEGQMFEYFSFDNYISVNGMEMPTRFAASSDISAPRASNFVPVSFQFNVNYNPSLFETVPSAQAGPDAWKPKTN